jgi:hypothetical protein
MDGDISSEVRIRYFSTISDDEGLRRSKIIFDGIFLANILQFQFIFMPFLQCFHVPALKERIMSVCVVRHPTPSTCKSPKRRL